MKSEMASVLMRRFKKFFPKTNWEEVNEYFKFSEKENLFCEYCGTLLLDEELFPYKRIVSVDHKKPLSAGGSNSFENLAICCTRCNIVKGTMTSETFLKFNKLLDQNKEWKEEIMDGLFWGRRANMIQRKNKDTPTKKVPIKYLHEFLLIFTNFFGVKKDVD